MTERLVYGDQHPDAESRNLRGGASASTSIRRAPCHRRADDFKGNLLRAERRVAREFEAPIDWSGSAAALSARREWHIDPAAVEAALAPLLENDRFVTLDRLRRDEPPRADDRAARDRSRGRTPRRAAVLQRAPTCSSVSTCGWTLPRTLTDCSTRRRRRPLRPASPTSTTTREASACASSTGTGRARRIATTRTPSGCRHLYTRRGAAFTGDCMNPAPPPPTMAAPEAPPSGVRCGLQNLQLHLRPGRQHHPHPRRRAADDLLPQPGASSRAATTPTTRCTG